MTKDGDFRSFRELYPNACFGRALKRLGETDHARMDWEVGMELQQRAQSQLEVQGIMFQDFNG